MLWNCCYANVMFDSIIKYKGRGGIKYNIATPLNRLNLFTLPYHRKNVVTYSHSQYNRYLNKAEAIGR